MPSEMKNEDNCYLTIDTPTGKGRANRERDSRELEKKKKKDKEYANHVKLFGYPPPPNGINWSRV